ncbi:MAG: ABC transporter permease subunit [Oscillospiraceae bacterium]|nr:ABC transporter permease subunit [Oscillospiraceae bacterium]
MKLVKRLGRGVLVLAFWLGLWALLARLVDTALLLPGPWAVATRLAELAVTLDFWRATAVSLLRVLLGAVLGVVTGVLLAALTSRFRLLRALLSPLLTIVRATPVASIILLALIWLGRDILPCFIVWLMVLPVVWANVSAGIEAVDGHLLELAAVYRFSWGRTLRRIYVPSVMPYFLSALRTGMGLAWKAGVAAEVLTVPAKSIGRYLYESKLYLETTDLFAWTAVVVLCSLVIEKLMLAAIGRMDRRWNRGGQA